ncbi:MAG TPA: hypothetical protein VFQ16_06465 [Burkholderiaceae bacterium]|nr:hypothetical protein [Burkholderiaceae bacterium]
MDRQPLRRIPRPTAAMALILLAASATAQGLGAAHGDTDLSGRLHPRIGLGTSVANWSGQSGVVLSDYYFGRTRLGNFDASGGFRATSGVLLGQRSAVLGAPAGGSLQPYDQWSATPYVGVGWSGSSWRKGWGVSADLGLAVRGSSGGLRIGSTQSLDDLLRELRLTPMVQVGVSYAF